MSIAEKPHPNGDDDPPVDNAIPIDAWNTVLFEKFSRFQHPAHHRALRPQSRRSLAIALPFRGAT